MKVLLFYTNWGTLINFTKYLYIFTMWFSGEELAFVQVVILTCSRTIYFIQQESGRNVSAPFFYNFDFAFLLKLPKIVDGRNNKCISVVFLSCVIKMHWIKKNDKCGMSMFCRELSPWMEGDEVHFFNRNARLRKSRNVCFFPPNFKLRLNTQYSKRENLLYVMIL